jgi:ribonuclease G
MANPKNRAAVEEALRGELERDRTKTYVVEISPLGLVEMTRQNITDGPREILTKPCPVCSGDGIVFSEDSAAIDLERRLRTIAAGSRSKAFRVEANARVASLLIGPGAVRLAEIEERSKHRFFLELVDGDALDHLVVAAEGSVEAMKPVTPVEEGDELELTLVEVGLYDSQAGVGKVGEYEVNVPDAAKLVGKKVKVRIERALKDSAYATLAEPGQEPYQPLTAESVAERPTRAPAKKAQSKAQAELAPVVETPAVVELGQLPVTTVAESSIVESGAEEEPPRPKKRTRRGSRGGRRRRKPSQAGVNAATGDGTGPTASGTAVSGHSSAVPSTAAKEPTPGDGEARAEMPAPRPRTQAQRQRASRPSAKETARAPAQAPAQPSEAPGPSGPSWSDQPAPDGGEAPRPKKRTRRGSRGGRRHRKPSQAGGAGTSAETSSAPVPAPEKPGETGSP